MKDKIKIHSVDSVQACQNCKLKFTIEIEDFNFYEKIKVPPPTFCSDCRMVRRLSWRNERTLYKNICDLCGKNLVSIYESNGPIKTYCLNCYYGDEWDSLEYGQDYDFSKPFFSQFKDLFLRVPKLATQSSSDIVNSEYTNHVGSSKNCYLVFASVDNEECKYCTHVNNSKNLIDCHTMYKSELCYECYNCSDCYNLKFSTQSQNCIDSWFLFNCRNCSNCFMCSNLVSKSYCINNHQYSKEKYLEYFNKIKIESKEIVKKNIKEFNLLKIKTPRKGTESINVINSTGSFLKNTKNCQKCFDVSNSEDEKYVGYSSGAKNIFDGYGVYPNSEFCYEVVASGLNSSNNYFCYLPWDSAFNLRYSTFTVPNCNNCFGCTQIKSKSYCILNKQYTKEEYEKLVPKIIQHMNDMPYKSKVKSYKVYKDKEGKEIKEEEIKEIVYKYGEFFPPELSPFAYNETIAQEYFPLTKEEALEKGYKWKDREARNYTIDIKNEDIPDDINDVNEDIIGKVIECQSNSDAQEGRSSDQDASGCTEAFKIIEAEYSFYKRMNLPLPRYCPNCRHYNRLKQRNPLKLWHRTCMKEKCTNEFETSYAPERPEIVYCEECYKREVY
jgi:hypothetical protein